jgi:hypothetical protein
MKSAGITCMPCADSRCWMIFRAISCSFMPVAWNEQFNPQSLHLKISIVNASCGFQHYSLGILNKCKAGLQCRHQPDWSKTHSSLSES